MSRLLQNQSIDRLIQSITSVTKSRCSLSDEDLSILTEALYELQNLKRKKGKTNKEALLIVAEVVELLIKIFQK